MTHILRASLLICLTSLMLINNKIYAENLGVFGQTFPIAEEDFLDFIQDKMNVMEKNGEWNQLENDFKNRVISSSDRPMALQIPRAIETKDHSFDPTIVLPFDLKDHLGHVLVRQGVRVNPLSLVKMRSIWIFFNGDDLNQITWVKDYIKNQSKKIKLILTQGSISQVEKTFNLPIYFDQKGKITTKLAIRHAPAVVMQDGNYLKIREVKV